MKLGVLSFVAALLAAPLAAQAAQSSARYAVTLRGSVVDSLTYEQDRAEGEDCRISRGGSGGHELRFRSVRPVTIAVAGLDEGVVYRPSRLTAVRLTGSSGHGGFSETMICRAAPIERKHGDCLGRPLAPRRVGMRFARLRENRIAFRAPQQPNEVAACGLDRHISGGWLHLAPGTVDEDALVNGRSLQVMVQGRRAPQTAVRSPGLKLSTKSVIRWTLTFRRLR